MVHIFGVHSALRYRAPIIVLALLVGCTPPTPPGPPTLPDATIPPAGPSPTLEATAAPQTHPLLLSRRALRELASFRVVSQSFEYYSSDASVVEEFEIAFQVQLSPQVGIASTLSTVTGVEEVVCQALGTDQQCWQRVGLHPWVRKPLWDQLAFTSVDVERSLAQIEILDDDVDERSGERVVRWLRSGPITHTEGTTWVQAETGLPLREETETTTVAGARLASSETVFSDFDQPVQILQPMIAALTPVDPVPEAASSYGIVEETPPFPGVLYTPETAGRYPAVVVLHGSDGGLRFAGPFAKQLAQAGFVTLAYSYFGCPGTPKELVDIELEPLLDAIRALAERPDVEPGALAVVGFSRGGDLALITGVLEPHVRAVVSVSGFASVIPGNGRGGDAQLDPAWRQQGQRLPFLAIPVEQINGPVLVLQGELDPLVSPLTAFKIADRMTAHDRPSELIVFPEPGHDLGMGMAPWIIRFLNDNLTGR